MLVALTLQASGLVKAMGAQDDAEFIRAIELSNQVARDEEALREDLAKAYALSSQTAKEEEKKRQEEKEKSEQIALDLTIARILNGDEPIAAQPAPVQLPTPKPAQKPVVPAKPQVPTNAKKQKTCNICLDDKNEQDVVNLACKHFFCKICLEGLVDTAIKDKNTKGLRCSEPACKIIISQADMAKITRDEDKLKMLGEIQFNEWANVNAKNCPTPGCTYIFVNDDDNANNVQCPKCTKHFCTGCFFQHATDISCADARLANDKDRSKKANDDWIKKNTKACPYCEAAVEKNGGCKYITCVKCHNEFCWACLAKTVGHGAHAGCSVAGMYID